MCCFCSDLNVGDGTRRENLEAIPPEGWTFQRQTSPGTLKGKSICTSPVPVEQNEVVPLSEQPGGVPACPAGTESGAGRDGCSTQGSVLLAGRCLQSHHKAKKLSAQRDAQTLP